MSQYDNADPPFYDEVDETKRAPKMVDLKWRTADGVYYYPWEMTDSHLKNCLLHIEGLYGGQAPETMWHQVFRCELKRREVQNAHQPPTAGTQDRVGAAILALDAALAKLSGVFERHEATPTTKRVPAKRPLKKGRKTK